MCVFFKNSSLVFHVTLSHILLFELGLKNIKVSIVNKIKKKSKRNEEFKNKQVALVKYKP